MLFGPTREDKTSESSIRDHFFYCVGKSFSHNQENVRYKKATLPYLSFDVETSSRATVEVDRHRHSGKKKILPTS